MKNAPFGFGGAMNKDFKDFDEEDEDGISKKSFLC